MGDDALLLATIFEGNSSPTPEMIESTKMKVIHVTTVHPREDMRIFRKECSTLAGAGFQVTLLVADGYGDAFFGGSDVDLEVGGAARLAVVDVGARPRGRVARILTQPWRMYRQICQASPDIVHVHDPELLPVALLLAKRKVKVVYDAHEDVPRQILAKHWIPSFLRGAVSRTFERFENFVVRRLAGVVAATPHIADRFRVINVNTIDINNFPLLAELAPTSIRPLRRRQVCYVGGIGRARGLGPLIRALPLVPDVRLVLCGRFSESDFESELKAMPGWAQVDFRGHVDREGVREATAESFAGVVTLLPTPAYLDALPVKMFEYMSAELPVIASHFPLWRQIIDGSGAGVCVDPQSPDEIASAIRSLADEPDVVEEMGKAGRAAVLSRYNWAHEGAKLTTFYRTML